MEDLLKEEFKEALSKLKDEGRNITRKEVWRLIFYKGLKFKEAVKQTGSEKDIRCLQRNLKTISNGKFNHNDLRKKRRK